MTLATVSVEGSDLLELSLGWQAAASAPGYCAGPSAAAGLRWQEAQAPGTAASALRAAGAWRPGDEHDFDGEDWWFRTTFAADPPAGDEELILRLDGIATVSEVYLNGLLVLESDSMFVGHTVDVGASLQALNELAICCRALGPLLAMRRRPRARWRTRLVTSGNLRFHRTTLLGRAPGFAPGPAAVGPWRRVRLERRRWIAVDRLSLRPRVVGGDGLLAIDLSLRVLDREGPEQLEAEVSGPSGTHRCALELRRGGGGITASGTITVPAVERWWPHTHGEPVLHGVRLLLADRSRTLAIGAGRVGFRELEFGAAPTHDIESDGIDLHVNGVRVFARGAVWTPPDPVGLAANPAELRRALSLLRDAGMNMVRLAGTGIYETDAFHDLCDELGVLVWQDFMFANLDYPIADPDFREAVTREARELLVRLAGRPSLAVLCGNSEVEQQVAMLGLDPGLGRGELFAELLPQLVRESATDATYVRSAPFGGDLPFRADAGLANYFGVGGYMRPLEDARLAGVRFASECLAFSNVPGESNVAQIAAGGADRVLADPRWKAAVPRDVDSPWDFEDVRDHYLGLLFDVDPATLRAEEPDRYLELARAASGEVMGRVLGEWRREASPCGGALILWLSDLQPGAGWGLLDSDGRPKAAYHHVRRALTPTAVWLTDEGLGGIDVHLANDGPSPLQARLRIALYRDFSQRVDELEHAVELAPHTGANWNLEALWGRFLDISWAYRFGPPAQDLVVASLERRAGEQWSLLSQAMCFPAGPPRVRANARELGLSATLARGHGADARLTVRSARLAHGVRVHLAGFAPEEDAFNVEPGRERVLGMRALDPDARLDGGWLTALNLADSETIELEQRTR